MSWYFKGISRWREILKIRIARAIGIKYGPYMIPVRDYWLFIDSYQRVWRITYSGYHDNPFQISLVER
jgi:hypothetical protein